MATTWIKSLHAGKGKTIAQTIFERTNYAKNPDKTKCGEFVTGFECDPRTAEEEFVLAKKEYEYITGRSVKRGFANNKRNVIAYHIRQSFKPGEVTPEEANEIGRELAMSFFKGKHAFIVATHVDKAHIHNHIIANSTTLDCTHKFKDFKRSGKTIRRISDLLCAEHGLSVIENPKLSKGNNYGDWADSAHKFGDSKPLSWREKLKAKIDEILPTCKTYEDFIGRLKSASCIVRDDKKHVSVMLPEQKRAIRLKSLGENYTEEAICERISKTKNITTSGDNGTQTHQFSSGKVSLLIDIQAKIREGKGRVTHNGRRYLI
ncbi:hypothetical protein FACS189499_07810 [Clostridia bacterium]|nr:hypothetical protein FACS189499_07810 [Clostridia bacterium]